jgi:hypothetical protein
MSAVDGDTNPAAIPDLKDIEKPSEEATSASDEIVDNKKTDDAVPEVTMPPPFNNKSFDGWKFRGFELGHPKAWSSSG